MSLALAPDLDWQAAAERLRATGRARLAGLLGEGAHTLHAALTAEDMVWSRAILNPFGSDVPVAVFESQPLEEQARLYAMVREEAAEGFQFVYDRLALARARGLGLPLPPALDQLFDLFNSEAFLDFARRFTGDDRIDFVDAQATRYLPGHFLNAHNDLNERTGRLYAYVLNLSPRWRAEWGGLLTFLDEAGDVTETFVPAFGALNVFRVPQDHYVSAVTSFAPAPRYAITGWWRTQPPPAARAA